MELQAERFGIEQSDFEQERHVFEMYRWVNEILKRLEMRDDFERRLFLRQGLKLKKFVEEAIRVTRLGHSLVRPFHEVFRTRLDR